MLYECPLGNVRLLNEHNDNGMVYEKESQLRSIPPLIYVKFYSKDFA